VEKKERKGAVGKKENEYPGRNSCVGDIGKRLGTQSAKVRVHSYAGSVKVGHKRPKTGQAIILKNWKEEK